MLLLKGEDAKHPICDNCDVTGGVFSLPQFNLSAIDIYHQHYKISSVRAV